MSACPTSTAWRWRGVLAESASATRIVVLTGYGEGRHVRAFVVLGTAGYLPKETPPQELAAILRSVRAGHTYFGSVAAQALRAETVTVAAARLLTPRELEVLRLIAADRHKAEIAAELCPCVKTVESHVSGALQKLGVRSRAAAVLRARDLDLL